MSDIYFKLAINLFNVNVLSIAHAEHEEFIELINDYNANDMFTDVSLIRFWYRMIKLYLDVSKMAIRILSPFLRHTCVNLVFLRLF